METNVEGNGEKVIVDIAKNDRKTAGVYVKVYGMEMVDSSDEVMKKKKV